MIFNTYRSLRGNTHRGQKTRFQQQTLGRKILPGSRQSNLSPGLRVLMLNIEIDRRQWADDGVRARFLQGTFRENGQHNWTTLYVRLNKKNIANLKLIQSWHSKKIILEV